MKRQLLVERFQLKFNVFGRDHIRIFLYFCTSAQLRKRTIVYIMDLIWLPHESVWINNPFPINFNITQTERSKNRSNSCKSEAESYQFHCVGGRKNTCILECYKSRKYNQHSQRIHFLHKVWNWYDLSGRVVENFANTFQNHEETKRGSVSET